MGCSGSVPIHMYVNDEIRDAEHNVDLYDQTSIPHNNSVDQKVQHSVSVLFL